MRIIGRVLWRERYEGEKQVYLTGVDLETGGDIKLAGDLPEIELMKSGGFEADVRGRLYGNNLSLIVKKFKFVLDKLT